jgi:glutamyl endopeptidase
MASPGHKPVTNTDRRVESRRAVFESAGPLLTSRQTLPYYKPPVRELARREVLESFAEALPVDGADGHPLLDAAAASFGSAAAHIFTEVLEAVIGEDDRMRVTPQRMAMNPWRQICALRIVSQTNKTYVGTGWFIGPAVLATAGHCVFLQDDGGWPKSIKVIPAKNGPQEPFGAFLSKRFASVDGWVDRRKRDFDYGVIFLDDGRVGSQVGNFAVQALSVSELKGTDAQISGYPADLDRAEVQYFHLRPVIDVNDTRLVYDIDTFGGQSGSPIWQDTVEKGVVAVGIHTTGATSSNSGTRITNDVLGNLALWVENENDSRQRNRRAVRHTPAGVRAR